MLGVEAVDNILYGGTHMGSSCIDAKTEKLTLVFFLAMQLQN